MVSPTDVADLPAIHASVSKTFASGRTRPLSYRLAQLRSLRRAFDATQESVFAAGHADLRRPRVETLLLEVFLISRELTYFIDNLTRLARSPTHCKMPGEALSVQFVPLGVCLQIAPFNVPIQLALRPLIGAIAAGNCVVLKPSELASAAEAYIVELFAGALDPEAFVVVTGDKEVSGALLEMRWNHITYTGGGHVGRIVAAAAARHLTPVLLELGGKNPSFVMPDADVGDAVRATAYGRWANCGQVCLCPDYTLVDEAVYDEFVAEMLATMGTWYGEDTKKAPAMSRIISKNHFSRVRSLLEKTGGKILAGGESDEADLFIAPTLVELTFEQMVEGDALMAEEIFGPVLVVVKMRDVDEGLSFVNSRDKALTLYVFAGSKDSADKVLSKTSSGLAAVNVCILHAATGGVWLAGVGESGMGEYGLGNSFTTFSHARQVVTWEPKVMGRVARYLLYPPAYHDKEGANSALTEKLLRLYLNIPGNGVATTFDSLKRILVLPAVAATVAGAVFVSQQLPGETWRNMLIIQGSILAALPLSVLARWQWRALRNAGLEVYDMFSSSQ